MTYRLGPKGVIQLKTADGWETRKLSPVNAKSMIDRVVTPWTKLAQKHSRRTGVPVSWILATIYQESRGRPDIIAHDRGGTTGVGLMMITYPGLKKGYTDEQLKDPDLNVRIGTDYLKLIRSKMEHDWDWVQATSIFNAGPNSKGKHWKAYRSQKPPWFVRGHMGHVDHEVRALNSYLLDMGGMADEVGGDWSGWVVGVGALLLAVGGWK